MGLSGEGLPNIGPSFKMALLLLLLLLLLRTEQKLHGPLLTIFYFHFNISSRHLTAKVGGPCHVIERGNVTYHLDTRHLSRVKSHF